MKLYRCSILCLAALLSLSVMKISYAECLISGAEPGDDFGYPESLKQSVALIDATTGCDSVSGQWGCRFDDGLTDGTVTCYKDPLNPSSSDYFVVQSSLAEDGSVLWEIDQNMPGASSTGRQVLAVDTALYGGASQGNACGQFFVPDVVKGRGGFRKSNGAISNVTYVDLCTDGLIQREPLTQSAPPPLCGQPGQTGAIDDVGITCPTATTDPVTGEVIPAAPSLVCNFESDELDGGQGDGEVCCFCNVDLSQVSTCEPAVEDECVNDDFREDITFCLLYTSDAADESSREELSWVRV